MDKTKGPPSGKSAISGGGRENVSGMPILRRASLVTLIVYQYTFDVKKQLLQLCKGVKRLEAFVVLVMDVGRTVEIKAIIDISDVASATMLARLKMGPGHTRHILMTTRWM